MFIRCRQFISLILPAVLLWSWVACIMGCAEIVQHGNESKSVWAATNNNRAECADSSCNSDNCSLTATPAALQERTTAPVYILTAKIEFTPSFKKPAIIPLPVRESDINQNSPPKPPNPLYLQFRNFRI